MIAERNIFFESSRGTSAENVDNCAIDQSARAVFIELIPSRIVNIERLIQTAKSADAPESLKGAGQIAHMLAGTAATLGMLEIGRLAKIVEEDVQGFLNTNQPTTQMSVETAQTIELLLDALEEEFFS